MCFLILLPTGSDERGILGMGVFLLQDCGYFFLVFFYFSLRFLFLLAILLAFLIPTWYFRVFDTNMLVPKTRGEMREKHKKNTRKTTGNLSILHYALSKIAS